MSSVPSDNPQGEQPDRREGCLIHSDKFDIRQHTEHELHQIYCGLDNAVTHECLEKELELFHSNTNPRPQAEHIYAFERALQAPYLEVMLRGFRIDIEARLRACMDLQSRIVRLKSNLDSIATALWDRGLNPRSNKMLRDFFYGAMKFPEIITSKKGIKKISLDRPALEKLHEHYLNARPFVSHILAIRDLSKQLEVLETQVDNDNRFRSSYNIAGTETGRPSSSESAWGTGCVRSDTAEALTPNGWKLLKYIDDSAEIAQWREGVITFVGAKINRANFSGDMFRIRGEQIDLTVTTDHRVIFNTWKDRAYKTKKAIEAFSLSQIYIPLGGKIDNTDKLNYPAFLAMLMADGHKEKAGWRLSFSKFRKIERFHNLMTEFGITFNEHKTRIGYRRFYIPGYTELPKKWGRWILDLTLDSAEALVEEARYWDAHDRGSGFMFSTADEEQARWFHTLVHLSGRAGTCYSREQSQNSWSDTTMWIVNVKNRNHAQVMRKHWSVIKYRGEVCCPTVPSGYWLVRENGFISVTGNSNAQNIAPALRYVFVPDPDYKLFVIDYEQSEARDLGFIIGCLFGDWSFLDACESGDLHTSNAKLVWPELPWTGDPARDKQIASRQFYRDFTYRDMSKRGGHLSNYAGTAFTMARHLKIPQKTAEDFQSRYCRGSNAAFPCIPRYWQWAISQIQTTYKIITPFGRERHFFGNTRDDATAREAIAFVPQSTTSDRTNLGFWRVWKHVPEVKLLAQGYDSLTFQVKEDNNTKDIIRAVVELLRVPITDETTGRNFEVPVEVKAGYNWGYASESNPNGLKKYQIN